MLEYSFFTPSKPLHPISPQHKKINLPTALHRTTRFLAKPPVLHVECGV
jgi:hypothetical protein